VRVDVVTIFPDYLAPLELSLIGKARRDGLLDVRVHDLRDFARDRHRTVDDTPYGGGAGMVMKPGPWAEALRRLGGTVGGEGPSRPRLLVPAPSGRPFTQAFARELATEPWLAFACGRYEGIDERVYAYAADSLGWDVTPVSLGDYVLNGGEVAVLAMVEAIARLIPGVVGNEESLVEESHEGGLLEYPVYTKPARWATEDSVYAVPPVLLSGNHAAIAAWRQEQRLARTAARRPDLLHASQAVSAGDLVVAAATPADAPELLVLQRACFVREIEAHGNDRFPALTEELPDVVAGLGKWRTLTARAGGRLVGAARGRLSDATTWEVSRVMVAPDLVGRGLGRRLLAEVEAIAPGEATAYRLLVAARAARTRRLYKKAGYRELPGAAEVEGTVAMGKRRAAPAG
jgi:tRNA (guanine37-N1)-methyltransferase